jgi:hypothetical protein
LANSSAVREDAGLVVFGGRDDRWASVGFVCPASFALLER